MPPRSVNIQDWSVQDVQGWLDDIGLHVLKEQFLLNSVGGEDLLEINMDDLTSYLGATPLQARKMLNEVGKVTGVRRPQPMSSQPSGQAPQPRPPYQNTPAALDAKEGWHYQLQDYRSDCLGCLETQYCQCCVYGDLAVSVGMYPTSSDGCKDDCLGWGIWPFGSRFKNHNKLRAAIRDKYGVTDYENNDKYVNIGNFICALFQEVREVRYREGLARSPVQQPTQPPQAQYMNHA